MPVHDSSMAESYHGPKVRSRDQHEAGAEPKYADAGAGTGREAIRPVMRFSRMLIDCPYSSQSPVQGHPVQLFRWNSRFLSSKRYFSRF